METNLLKSEINRIKMSSDMKERILQNCSKASAGNISEFKSNKKRIRKSLTIAASLVLCLCLAGITTLAATGQLNGFFTDVKDWKGAVTGTTYENATNEIDMMAAYDQNNISLAVTFLNNNVPPYNAIESVEIGKYAVTDESGNIVYEGNSSDAAFIENGNAVILLPLENIPSGTSELTVYSFIGSKKADAPLPINGTWKSEFSI